MLLESRLHDTQIDEEEDLRSLGDRIDEALKGKDVFAAAEFFHEAGQSIWREGAPSDHSEKSWENWEAMCTRSSFFLQKIKFIDWQDNIIMYHMRSIYLFCNNNVLY